MADAQMADATDGKLKDLKISETKKSKKDGAPKKAPKPQQQKKKVGLSTDLGFRTLYSHECRLKARL
jgi:hypothetical protein